MSTEFQTALLPKTALGNSGSYVVDVPIMEEKFGTHAPIAMCHVEHCMFLRPSSFLSQCRCFSGCLVVVLVTVVS